MGFIRSMYDIQDEGSTRNFIRGREIIMRQFHAQFKISSKTNILVSYEQEGAMNPCHPLGYPLDPIRCKNVRNYSSKKKRDLTA